MSVDKSCSIVAGELSKKNLNKLIRQIAETYGLTEEQIVYLLDELMKLGFELSTISGVTVSLADFEIPPEIQQYKKKLYELAKEGKIEEYEKTLNEALEWLKKYEEQIMSNNYILNESGAGRGWKNTQNFKIARGYFVNLREQLIEEPINKALAEGLNPKEYFMYGHAARKGIVDRVKYTQEPGYLMRQFVYTLSSVVVKPGTKCKPKALLPIQITKDIADRVLLRYIKDGNKDVLLTKDNINDYIGKTVLMYSPIYCTWPNGICERCYGKKYEQMNSTEVGIMAAHAIGERLYTALLKSFHKGAKGNVLQPTVLEFAKMALDFAKKFAYTD